MTYPPTQNPDGTNPPPPDPPVQPYQPYQPPAQYHPAQQQPLPSPYEIPPIQPPMQQAPVYDPYGPTANPYTQPANPYVQQPYDYGNPGSPYAYSPYTAMRRPTDGLAIASLVISCVSVPGLCGFYVGGVLGVLGAIFGHVARRRIRRSGASGNGLALAGIIVGWVVTGLAIITAIVVGVAMATTPDSSGTF